MVLEEGGEEHRQTVRTLRHKLGGIRRPAAKTAAPLRGVRVRSPYKLLTGRIDAKVPATEGYTPILP